MEDLVKQELGLSRLKKIGPEAGGCISSGAAYDTDKYGKVFIKTNPKSGARTMFDGEYASLEALGAPGIVRVPKPIKVLDNPSGGALIVMEYLDMTGGLSQYAATLGEQLARLHLHNASLKEKSEKGSGSIHQSEGSAGYVSRFGFDVNTCCGYIEMDNTWCEDWPTFYANKIETQIKLAEKKTGDREARQLWNKVLDRLPAFFEGLDIQPAILHGDLWGGNVSEVKDGPVIFDPASYYGHSEFDLGISYMFGGFNSKFFNAYHNMIPKAPGFAKRKDLYELFHYVNHWNHFGGGYRSSSLSTLQACINHVYK